MLRVEHPARPARPVISAQPRTARTRSRFQFRDRASAGVGSGGGVLRLKFIVSLIVFWAKSCIAMFTRREDPVNGGVEARRRRTLVRPPRPLPGSEAACGDRLRAIAPLK